MKMPPKRFFGHLIKKCDTSTFLEDKMRGRTKNATKMIIECHFCSVLKGHDYFREYAKTRGPKM